MRAARVENRCVKSLALMLVLAVAACSRSSDGPACGAVGAKFMALAKDDLVHKGVSDEVRRAVEAQLPAMRDSLVHACTDGTWASGVRSCLVAANDRVAFEACEQQLTDAQRQALDRSARGESSDGASK
jgi:hypothetical protein